MSSLRALSVPIALMYSTPLGISDVDYLLPVPSKWLVAAPEYLPSLDEALVSAGFVPREAFVGMPPAYRVRVFSRALFLFESLIADVLCVLSSASDLLELGGEPKFLLDANLAYLGSRFLGQPSISSFDASTVSSMYFSMAVEKRCLAWLTDYSHMDDDAKTADLVSMVNVGVSLCEGDLMVSPRFQGLPRRLLPLSLSQSFTGVKRCFSEISDVVDMAIAALNEIYQGMDKKTTLNLFSMDDRFASTYFHLCFIAESLALDMSRQRYEVQNRDLEGKWVVSSYSNMLKGALHDGREALMWQALDGKVDAGFSYKPGDIPVRLVRR